jgi:hypothetical protein
MQSVSYPEFSRLSNPPGNSRPAKQRGTLHIHMAPPKASNMIQTLANGAAEERLAGLFPTSEEKYPEGDRERIPLRRLP